MKILNNTKNLVLLSLAAASLAACNNAGSSGDNNSTAQANSTTSPQASAKSMFGSHDNKVYFDNTTAIPDPTNSFFTEYHHITTIVEDWDGISTFTDDDGRNGINIKAGRKGDSENYYWITDQYYGGVNNKTNWASPEDFNFVVTGNFKFSYLADAQSYECHNVAIAQVGNGGGNEWVLYSNIAPGLAVDAAHDKNTRYVNILCDNQDGTSNSQNFQVWATGTQDKFKILKGYTNESAILDDTSFNYELTHAFNSLDGATQKKLFANGIYGNNGDKLEITNPQAPKLNFYNESSAQDMASAIEADNTTLLTEGHSELTNNTDLQQTPLSSAFSYAVTNSVTTTNTDTAELTIAGEYQSPLILKILLGATKVTITGKYSHVWSEAVTTAEVTTYTAPSQPILLPPHTKAIIDVKYTLASFSGKFNYYQYADDKSSSNSEAIRFTKGKTPELLASSLVPIYDTFAAAQTITTISPKITIDPVSKSIVLVGSGTYEGKEGTNFQVVYSIYPIDTPASLIATTKPLETHQINFNPEVINKVQTVTKKIVNLKQKREESK